jgi:large subunit ribosomal protein L21
VYAIIEDSGKQIKVTEGQVLDVDIRPLSDGQTNIEFDRVLLLSDGTATKVGAPIVSGAKVTAVVEASIKGPKIDIVHFIRRKGHLTRKGHRQNYMRVRISKIVG